ncbi:fgd6 protein [Nannochloropsis gaditana]|uniref:Fgd6 protein n=1 Tax=Nannochloropsis gaditana TaxID=72520 RepID=W7TMX9_9STRA|nr:fgd6 protein [Nannochloropsis gaditana]
MERSPNGRVPLSWRHVQQFETRSPKSIQAALLRGEDTLSTHSVASRLSNAKSSYSATTFQSFATSNYSGFSAAGDLSRKMKNKKHHVHPSELDPTVAYDVEWVHDELALSCMVCMAEFSPLMRRKHHCRACGRVVCSGCSSARVLVLGLRGLQKACTDCVRGAEKLRACESISEDSEGGVRLTEEQEENDATMEGLKKNEMTRETERSPGRVCGSNSSTHVERKVEGDKQEERQQALENDDEPFPQQAGKKKKQRSKDKTFSTAGIGLLAVGCTALAIGSALAMSPKLLSGIMGRFKR